MNRALNKHLRRARVNWGGYRHNFTEKTAPIRQRGRQAAGPPFTGCWYTLLHRHTYRAAGAPCVWHARTCSTIRQPSASIASSSRRLVARNGSERRTRPPGARLASKRLKS